MVQAAPAHTGRAGRSCPLPLRQGAARNRHGLHPAGPAHPPSRWRLGVDDRCWLLPCHYLYQGRDEVKGLLLVFLPVCGNICLCVCLFSLGRGFGTSPDVPQWQRLFWLSTNLSLTTFLKASRKNTPKAVRVAEGL